MNQSNEIALQLVNNYTEDIDIALFPNVNNAQFVQLQTEETVEANLFDIGITNIEIGSPIVIQQTSKKTNVMILMEIPYTGTPEGSGLFVPSGFIDFCYNWFPENNFGYIIDGSAPNMTIYSDLYEYGKLEFTAGP